MIIDFSTTKSIKTIHFSAFNKNWVFDCEAKVCCEIEECVQENGPYSEEMISPDG